MSQGPRRGSSPSCRRRIAYGGLQAHHRTRHARVSPSTVLRIAHETASAAGAAGMVGNQTMGVLYDAKKGTKKIVSFIHKNKTSTLVSASVLARAMVGKADKTRLSRFARCGESIGLAFQIKG